MDYVLPFGLSAGVCAWAFGGEVATLLVGAGMFTLKVGKFALSVAGVRRVVGAFGGSVINMFLAQGLRLLALRLFRRGLRLSLW
jgi:hypothetical protein